MEPWSSSRARPVGVRRRGGRGFVVVVIVVVGEVREGGGGRRDIVGIFLIFSPLLTCDWEWRGESCFLFAFRSR